jgi:tetratricopeptide (TPR) repeat protein
MAAVAIIVASASSTVRFVKGAAEIRFFQPAAATEINRSPTPENLQSDLHYINQGPWPVLRGSSASDKIAYNKAKAIYDAAAQHYYIADQLTFDSHVKPGHRLSEKAIEKAIIDDSIAVRLEPNIAGWQSSLASLLVMDGQQSQAIPHFQRAITLYSNMLTGNQSKLLDKMATDSEFNDLMGLGNAYLATKQYANAVVQYNKALSLGAWSQAVLAPPILISLGTALADEGNITGARAAWQRVIDLKPTSDIKLYHWHADHEPMSSVNACQWYADQARQLIAKYDAVDGAATNRPVNAAHTALDPLSQYEKLLSLGVAPKDIGELNGQVTNIATIHSTFDTIDAHQKLASAIFFGQPAGRVIPSDYSKRLDAVNQQMALVVQAMPNDAQNLGFYAQCLMQRGLKDEAIPYYEKAVEINKRVLPSAKPFGTYDAAQNDAICWDQALGEIFFDKRQFEKSAERYKECLTLENTAVFDQKKSDHQNFLDSYGKSLAAAGHTNEARAAWQRIIDLQGSSTDTPGAFYAADAKKGLASLPKQGRGSK